MPVTAIGQAANNPSWGVWRLAAVIAIGFTTLWSVPARADFEIPTGGFMSLADGGLDLGCTDLIVGGMLQTNSAPVTNVRNVIIQSGGTIDAGSSVISVGGNWSNSGTFNAGTSQVAFSDICGVNPAVVSGNTTFYDVSFTSSSGKTWQFASGSTQTIAHFLSIQGTTPNPLQFASTVPGAGHFAFMAQSVWPLASEAGDAAANPEGFDRVAYHATLENEVAEFLDRQLR